MNKTNVDLVVKCICITLYLSSLAWFEDHIHEEDLAVPRLTSDPVKNLFCWNVE